MGWPSSLDHIRDRQNDAEHFRQAAVVTADTVVPVATPAVIHLANVTPEPLDDPAKQHCRKNWWQRFRLSGGRFAQACDTFVWRGGAQRYTERINDVWIRASDSGGPRRALQIDFKISSKGGGETHLSPRIGARIGN